MRYLLTAALCTVLLAGPVSAEDRSIREISQLDPNASTTVKSIRDDIRTSMYVIKSGRSSEELPELKFYRYRVKKGDNFWKILAKCSLDIDTLISVNSLASPKDVVPGITLYIPNMRGIITSNTPEKKIKTTLAKSRVRPEYVYTVNRISDFSKDHLFIPCGKVSSLERSLFLGTGFMYPLNGGRRTSGFGVRRNPFNHRHSEFHSGIDIACPMKSKIFAARDGRVVFAGFKGGYGNLVVLRHEHGYYSYYGHLSRALVRPGQTVRRGAVIAYSGNTGRTTGPHLHFEIRKGGRPVNPGYLVKR